MYYTPLQINKDPEVLVDVGLHDSIFRMLAGQNIATDVIAPLLDFDRRVLQDAKQVTYAVVHPFEYFPFLEIVYASGLTQYWTHGAYSGWEKIEDEDSATVFAGTRPPEEGETGTVSTGIGPLQVAVNKALIPLMQETLGG